MPTPLPPFKEFLSLIRARREDAAEAIPAKEGYTADPVILRQHTGTLEHAETHFAMALYIELKDHVSMVEHQGTSQYTNALAETLAAEKGGKHSDYFNRAKEIINITRNIINNTYSQRSAA